MDIQEYIRDLAGRAKAAAAALATASSARKDAALRAMAEGIEAKADPLKAENAKDLEAGRKTVYCVPGSMNLPPKGPYVPQSERLAGTRAQCRAG